MPTKKNTTSTSFDEFIKTAGGLPEVALFIAKDDAEVKNFTAVLKKRKLSSMESVFEYSNDERGQYLVVNKEKDFKVVYDFICQYPLSVISLYNEKLSKVISIKPDYHSPMILIVNKKTIKKITDMGFDLLGRCGVTYRS